jgi:hypothetical protein
MKLLRVSSHTDTTSEFLILHVNASHHCTAFVFIPLSSGGESSDTWLLHTRPIVCAAHVPPPLLSKLLTPMVNLTHSESLLPTYQNVQLSLARMPGMPVLRYKCNPEALECTGILV